MVSNLNNKLLLNKAGRLNVKTSFIKTLLKFKNKINLLTRHVKLSLFFFKKINRKLFKNTHKIKLSNIRSNYTHTFNNQSRFNVTFVNKLALKHFIRIKKKTYFSSSINVDITTAKNNKLLLKHKKFLCKNLSKIPNSTFSDTDFIDFKFLTNTTLANHIGTSKICNVYNASRTNIKQNHNKLTRSMFKSFGEIFNYTNNQTLILFLSNPFFLKVIYSLSSYHKKYYEKNNVVMLKKLFNPFINKLVNLSNLEKKLMSSNIIPNKSFNYVISKRISSAVSNKALKENFIP
jgi:hypothetical protein